MNSIRTISFILINWGVGGYRRTAYRKTAQTIELLATEVAPVIHRETAE